MTKKILAAVTLAMVMMASGCGGSTSESVGGTDSTPIIESSVSEQVLWDSENVKVTFIEIFEYDYLPGYCYVRLKVENKSDKTITVYPKDAYVNDTSIILASGIPMTIAPGKQSQTPFVFTYNNLGITSKDEIQKIEFKMWFDDENYETIEETDNLVVNLS